MTKRDLVSLAMKVIGVFYLIQIVPFGASFFMSEGLSNRFLQLIPVVGVLGAGLLLVFGSGAIARLIVPHKEDATVSSALSLSDWQTILFSAIGVSTFVQALRSMSAFLYYPKQNMQLQSLVSGIVMMVIGILLFFQARGLANLWRLIQEHRSHENEDS